MPDSGAKGKSSNDSGYPDNNSEDCKSKNSNSLICEEFNLTFSSLFSASENFLQRAKRAVVTGNF